MVTKESSSKYVLPLYTQSRFQVHLDYPLSSSVKPSNMQNSSEYPYFLPVLSCAGTFLLFPTAFLEIAVYFMLVLIVI